MIYSNMDMNHFLASVEKWEDGKKIDTIIINKYCKNDEEFNTEVEKYLAKGYSVVIAKHDVPCSEEEWEENFMGEVF